MSHDSRRLRIVAVDHLIQFVESSIHSILVARGVYPNIPTTTKKRFGICVRLIASTAVSKYVKNFLTSLRAAITNDRVHVISVLIQSTADPALRERFNIEMPHDFARALLHEKNSYTDLTELDVACTASLTLKEAYQGLERRLSVCAEPLKGPRTWELYVDVKPTANNAEMLDTPVGFATLDESSETAHRDVSDFVRFPLKSSSIDDKVVLLTYLDRRKNPS